MYHRQCYGVTRRVRNLNTATISTYPTQDIRPLRLKYKEVCVLLSVTRDCLRKIIESDASFPRPMKEGKSRQAPVYFDTKEIEEWYEKYKQKCREVKK